MTIFRRMLLASLLVALSGVTEAQERPAISFEQLTIAATALNLAGTTINPPNQSAAQQCHGIVETADVRVRIDGTAATGSVGNLVPVGAIVHVRGADSLRRFSVIRAGGTSAALALTCYATADSGPALEILPGESGTSTTGTGAEVHATSPTLVTPTLTTPTITAPAISGTGSIAGTYSGEPLFTGRVLARESFEQPHLVREEDFTAKVVTDNGVMLVLGSPVGIIKFHEEVTKTASSWVETDGVLDIKGDNDADNEGVEIYLGDEDDQTTGWIVAGTTGLCFEVSITVGDISGTDQFLIGWRQNEAFEATNVYTSYNDWSVVGINNADGSVFALTEVAGGGTLSDDSGTNLADASTATLKSCISTAGVHSASLNGTAITITNGGTAHTAGDQMNPFITFLAAGVDGAEPQINWMQITAHP